MAKLILHARPTHERTVHQNTRHAKNQNFVPRSCGVSRRIAIHSWLQQEHTAATSAKYSYATCPCDKPRRQHRCACPGAYPCQRASLRDSKRSSRTRSTASPS